MGICGSVDRGHSGRITYTGDAPAMSHETGSSQQHADNLNQTDNRLSGLSDINRSRPAPSTSLTTPNNQSPKQIAVTNALKTIRKNYYRRPNLKSSNKKHLSGGEAEIQRVAKARDEILRMREEQLFDNENDVIGVITGGKAHNCEELARLAAFTLQEDMGLTARIVSFGSDHCAAAIGAGDGPLPADMTKWDPDIYICDPWCNIACSAQDYPSQFAAKMKKWAQSNKHIKTDDRCGFIPPTDQQWISTVLSGEKSAY